MENRDNNCPDCGVITGEPHTDGCDVERCLQCGGQRFSCGCANENDIHDIWTGIWPGVEECHEFGWYVKLISGQGWVRCSKDDSDATEDLDRLYTEAEWDKNKRRFILKS